MYKITEQEVDLRVADWEARNPGCLDQWADRLHLLYHGPVDIIDYAVERIHTAAQQHDSKTREAWMKSMKDRDRLIRRALKTSALTLLRVEKRMDRVLRRLARNTAYTTLGAEHSESVDAQDLVNAITRKLKDDPEARLVLDLFAHPAPLEDFADLYAISPDLMGLYLARGVKAVVQAGREALADRSPSVLCELMKALSLARHLLGPSFRKQTRDDLNRRDQE